MLLGRSVRPRQSNMWRWQGLLLHILTIAAFFGFFLAGSGSVAVSGVLVTALMALFTITSNAKHGMLGEPLIFSDLALIAALFRHPRFYFTAIPKSQRRTLAVAGPVLLLGLALLFVPRWAPHLAGLALAGGAGLLMRLLILTPAFTRLAPVPDADADLGRYGLIATLLLYWWRWRGTPDPVPCVPSEAAVSPEAVLPDLVVIVQCESFADPVDLTGLSESALPGLSAARGLAWQWGDLGVSGFGAYTMRTEYGVLFGRSEPALGFRRYDPFLTAFGEASYALSARLGVYGYRSLFVHPHDMRFYGRDRLMPAIGFDRVIGEENFASVPRDGRYVDDRALGEAIGTLIDSAVEPTLIYSVTMENHGPWDMDRAAGKASGLEAYLDHLRSSDAMLSGLVDRISSIGRSGVLVFFGDHRPSIPGVTEPGNGRHTPYVMLRFGAGGRLETGANRRVDLTPDELHHAILGCVQDAREARMEMALD